MLIGIIIETGVAAVGFGLEVIAGLVVCEVSCLLYGCLCSAPDGDDGGGALQVL